VVRVRDGLGNSRDWDHGTNTVTARVVGRNGCRVKYSAPTAF
jgi:hypothetical protein